MDDRTFTARTSDGLVRITDAWKDWWDRVGLIESISKAQFTAGTQGQRTPLDQLAFDQASTHVLFLRIVTRGHPRTNADREQARTDLCRDRLAARV